ncbi:MAG: leucine-rich repeat domain-containing protein [Oscillospiraceae bacterium]|nr:leucine-rich repeat domain-containing protein [Oscillospiraceae bacterium]
MREHALFTSMKNSLSVCHVFIRTKYQKIEHKNLTKLCEHATLFLYPEKAIRKQMNCWKATNGEGGRSVHLRFLWPLVMLLLLLTLSGCGKEEKEQATSGACGENLSWELKDGTLTISGTGEMENYSLDAFATTTTYTTPWYNMSSEIQTIVIEEGVTSIGDYAFIFISADTTIPDSVTSIGAGAFEGNDQLEQVSFGDKFTYIGEYAFFLCSGLVSVSIGGSDVDIGDEAFAGCESLTYVNIGSVSTVGDRAFSCGQLQEVTLGGSVQALGEKVFMDCDSLTRVTIDGSGMSIGFRAFYDCDTLNSVSFGTVSTVGNSAFAGCDQLGDVTLDGVTSIGWLAFCSSGLTSITISGSDAKIGESALSSCSDLTSATISGVAAMDEEAFQFCSSLTEFAIPEGVTAIKKRTFFQCTQLTAITIPVSVTFIGDSAFYSCEALTDIYYGGSQAQWEAVQISDVDNEALAAAAVHFADTA